MARAETVEVYIASKKTDSQLDIVFVHGLMGTAKDTWLSMRSHRHLARMAGGVRRRGSSTILPICFGGLTPEWAYLSAREKRGGRLANYGLGPKPIIWVIHSLGGLLVKSMLRAAHELFNPNWEPIVRMTRGVVFVGTPIRELRLVRCQYASDARERERYSTEIQ